VYKRQGVAGLHDVAAARHLDALVSKIPVHHVPATSAEAEVDRRGVHHDPIADRDLADHLGEHIGALAVDGDALQSGSDAQDLVDEAAAEGRHVNLGESQNRSERP